MLFELRTYECKPGKREAWVKMMEEEIIPFQVSKGMVILGSFIAEQDDSTYVWIRRFVDEAERELLYKAVYESEHWRNDLSPRVGELLNRETIKVTRLIPTPKSVIQ
ncbi:MAG TPA: NIPSNAP family protein [Caldilineaceae bacterium]|nr:NIPSNAP family protein [Caldilineaceae bacterium]HRW04012.1 NIPSNAP family protein [Caldilineaceae bacterium]